MGVEQLLSHIARALRIPVLTLAIIALAAVLAELGALAIDVLPPSPSLARAHSSSSSRSPRMRFRTGDVPGALAAMRAIALTPIWLTC
jgi:hypothetical protein